MSGMKSADGHGERLHDKPHDDVADLRKRLERLERECAAARRENASLAESEARYRDYILNFSGIAFRGSMDFVPEFFQGAVQEMTGYAEEELLSGNPRWDQVVHKDDLPLILEQAAGIREVPGVSIDREYRIVRKDGGIRWVREFIRNVCDGSGRPSFVHGAIYDITGRKLVEERLRDSIEEKEVLLGELHHRVKNNIQLIMSLLRLETRKIKDPAALELVEEISGRLRVLALAHDMIVRAENLAGVDVAECLRRVADFAFSSFPGVAPRVRLAVNADGIALKPDAVLPFGIIAYELLTNAAKHAFPGQRRGIVAVTMARQAGDGLALSVRDDGVGLPEGFDLQRAESVGMTLVKALAEQLGGSVALSTDGGVEFRIICPGSALPK